MAITPEQARAELARRELARRASISQPPPQASGNSGSVSGVARNLVSPVTEFIKLNKQLANNPNQLATNPIIQAGLPIAGGTLAGPAGAIAGEAARQFLGAAVAPETVPETALGRAASMLGAGVAQAPMVFPGVPQAAKAIKATGSKVGNVLAKMGEALTGAKAQDLKQAAKQGVSTYAAPSMEKAQKIFGQALEKEGISGKAPLRQIIDPQLTTARKVALKVGEKLEKGAELTAKEALNGRQALDRIYAATPIADRGTRRNILELRNSFDDILSNKSGALAEASKIYRKALVKSSILNPFRITKQGQYSAVAPMVATLAASSLGAGGDKEKGIGGGLGYLLASSPAVAGALATGGGSAFNTAKALASRPEVRQAILQLIQKTQRKSPQQK